jgi:GTP-binding protein HflX
MNKIDRVGLAARVDRDDDGRPWRVWVSAAGGDGLEVLREVIGERMRPDWVDAVVPLRFEQARLRARLFELDAVVDEAVDENGWRLRVSLARRELDRLCHDEGCAMESLCEVLGAEAAVMRSPTGRQQAPARETMQEVFADDLE